MSTDTDNTDIFDLHINPPGRLSGKNQWTLTLDCGLETHTDKLDITRAKSRKDFIEEVIKRFPAIAKPDCLQKLKDDLERHAARPLKPPPPPAHVDAIDPEALLAEMSPAARMEADRLLSLPDHHLMAHVLRDAETLGVAGERELVLMIYLTGTSRLLVKPLAVIVQGPSSSGKSYLIEKIASLFPPEAVIQATQMTPQALFYMPPGSLVHRFVVAGERSRVQDDETAESTRALREMLSGSRLSKLLPVKGPDGMMQTQRIEQEGPIAYVESTTLSKVFEEDESRCLMMHTDEQCEQTRRIINATAAKYNGKPPVDTQAIIDRHHALQRMLPRQRVSIPYAERLGDLFSDETVFSRRAIGHCLNLIGAVTLLHHRHRQTDAEDRLIATPDDYQHAWHLLLKPLSRLLSQTLSDPARRFYDQIVGRMPDVFTSREAAKLTKGSESSVKGWFRELHDAAWLEQVEASRGRTAAKWRFSDAPHEEAAACSLPTPEKLFAQPTCPLAHKQ